jgi:PAS domain S-box-containing protein
MFDLIHPDDVERGMEDTAEVIGAPGPAGRFGEHRFRHKDGSYCYLQATANSMLEDPSIRGVVCTVRDVTERKQLEERLRFLSLLVENAEDVIGVTETDGTIRYMSPSVERVLGYRPEEMVGTNSFGYLHPDDHEWAAGAMTAAVSNPGPARRVEFRYRHKDGTWRYLEATGHNLLEDQHSKGILSVARDITRRKQAEKALRDSEECFRVMFENASDIITILETNGTIRYASPSLERVLGYQPEEWIGTNAFDRVHPDDLEHVTDAFTEHMSEEGISLPVEFRTRSKNGEWRYFEAIGNNLDRSSEEGTVVISRDITERKRAEEEIRGLNETLEKRVAERTAQLEDTIARLESNEQMLRESEEQLQDLVSKLLTAQEDERRRVAYEIHDGLAQVANAARQHLEALVRRNDFGDARRNWTVLWS